MPFGHRVYLFAGFPTTYCGTSPISGVIRGSLERMTQPGVIYYVGIVV